LGQKVLIIDVTKCTGCFDCFIACKDEFAGQPWLPYSQAQPELGHYWMLVGEIERGLFPKVKSTFLPQPCMHCQNPPCVRASKNGAVYQRDDGIVIIDPEKSKGQKRIVKACPYGRIYWNEELNIPQKCDMCAHLLDKGWKEPRCVEACPARVFTFGEREELSELIDKAEQLHPEYKTNPGVYYIGLPKTFIAGSVYGGDNGDCIENANITLFNKVDNETLATKTNNYGDFEFDGLEAGSIYYLTIQADGYYPLTVDDINLKNDVYLGSIRLQKKRPATKEGFEKKIR
jgi:tetrathionate reductase subunit B